MTRKEAIDKNNNYKKLNNMKKIFENENETFEKMLDSEDKKFDLETAKNEYEYHKKRIKEILKIYPQFSDSDRLRTSFFDAIENYVKMRMGYLAPYTILEHIDGRYAELTDLKEFIEAEGARRKLNQIPPYCDI